MEGSEQDKRQENGSEPEQGEESEQPKPRWQQRVDEVMMPLVMKMYDPEFNEKCPVKSVQTFIAGGFFGFFFGAFISALGSPNSMYDPDAAQQNWRQATIDHFKQMGRSGYSTMKTFAVVGAVYSASECVIEKHRAKHDLWNPALAGCFSGGVLAARAGLVASGLGCVSFAAFSLGIDYLLMDRGH
jgi:import inner membrane translocase subunit TIM22